MIFPLELLWEFPIAMVDYQGVYSVTGDFTGVNKRRSLFQQQPKKDRDSNSRKNGYGFGTWKIGDSPKNSGLFAG